MSTAPSTLDALAGALFCRCEVHLIPGLQTRSLPEPSNFPARRPWARGFT